MKDKNRTWAGFFRYEGFFFEWHPWLGPTKLNKDGTASKRMGVKFYNVIDKWLELPDEEREETRSHFLEA